MTLEHEGKSLGYDGLNIDLISKLRIIMLSELEIETGILNAYETILHKLIKKGTKSQTYTHHMNTHTHKQANTYKASRRQFPAQIRTRGAQTQSRNRLSRQP